MRYLRRDEDSAQTGPLRLLARQGREFVRDIGLAWRQGLIWPVLEFHVRLVAGRPGDGRAHRWVRVAVGRRTARCHLRAGLSDLFVLREVFVYGIYEFPYEEAGGEVRTVLDLGSNMGASPLYFSLRFPNARVVCVEPVPENAEELRVNAAANGFDWVVEQAAVAGQPGEVRLFPSGWWASSSTTQSVAEARTAFRHRPERDLALPPLAVRAVTVDQLLDAAGWESADLLKVDVEGAEEQILLDGRPDWLRRVRVLALDIHAKYVSRERIVARLAEYGFSAAADHGPHSAIFVRR
ncbi:FkbM family methyltransferase [Frankia sp. CiP1_Cm_nod2]|uniref:FkbM family methyltransferase n=1 Tax=Frankia sp. CiP1_Cm_nod2 TaxID=2897161 RepID=UPI002025191E